MADKIEILTGYHRPFAEDENFRDAMARCNDALNFKPLMERDVFIKEKAEELNTIVKKRSGK